MYIQHNKKLFSDMYIVILNDDRSDSKMLGIPPTQTLTNIIHVGQGRCDIININAVISSEHNDTSPEKRIKLDESISTIHPDKTDIYQSIMECNFIICISYDSYKKYISSLNSCDNLIAILKKKCVSFNYLFDYITMLPGTPSIHDQKYSIPT
jgi:hypothetical protein